MEQKKTNQERGRKTRGSSKALDDNQPSKAPGQDEDGRESVGTPTPDTDPVDGYSEKDAKQGISNRPANEEHAFPGGEVPEGTETDRSQDDVQGVPTQLGGNRGGV